MTKKRLALLVLAICVAAGLAAGILLLNNDDKQSSSVSKPKSSSNRSADPSVVPPPTSHTLACDLMDKKLAAKTLGQDALKSQPLPTSGTGDYSATSCEYSLNNKKASITLYKYRTAKTAQSDKKNVESRQLVLASDGKSVQEQPKSSVAVVKDRHVVTATVMSGGVYDPAASKQLAQDAAGKL